MAVSANSYPFPSDFVDPREKGFDWILRWAKAAWYASNGFTPAGYLYKCDRRYDEIKSYKLGIPSINKYKKLQTGDEQANNSWMTTDWTPPALLPKYREIIVSKILQNRFDVRAYAVDPLARSEEDKHFNAMKVKIMMREAAMEAGSELSDSPVLKAQLGEPEDVEQLQIEMQYGYKHVMAMEAELAIQLIMQQNDGEELRKRTIEELVDIGIGGFVPWIDENGHVKYRAIRPDRLGLSYCSKPDFSDLKYFFEVIDVLIDDLAPYFTKDQLKDICQKVSGKYGNPTFQYRDGQRFWENFKVQVVDLKFISVNDTVYKTEIDSRGNERFGKSSFQNMERVMNPPTDDETYEEPEEVYEVSVDIDEKGGQSQAKYMHEAKKVYYRTKWIIDTDYMYDYGLGENMIRKQSNWWDTELPIVLYAWNFHEMKFTGLTERLIPYADKYANAWYRLQNLTNKLIPYLINIDLNVLESTSFGKGGENWTPAEVLDFVYSNFVVPYRSTDLLNRNPNYKPVSIEASGQLAAFGIYYEDLQNCERMMQVISGLNDLTDGSSPNSKTLVPVAQAAIQGTNNALYLVMKADKYLQVKLSEQIIQNVQIAVKLGKVEGYVRSLGAASIKFWQISPDISLHEFGIFLEDYPTDEERQLLLQDLSLKESQGLIDPSDKIMVMNTPNIKQAAMFLAYKITKREEAQRQFELQKIQEANQGQQDMILMTKQLEQENMQMQAQLTMQQTIIEKKLEYAIEEMKKTMDVHGEAMQVQGRLDVGQLMAEAKVISSQIAGEASIHKQHLANKAKPKTPAKKK